MSAPKFTPGPWRIEESRDRSLAVRTEKFRIAKLLGSTAIGDVRERFEADASLIAAAPDMHEGHRKIYALVGKIAALIRSGTFSEDAVWVVCEEIENVSRAAIAKAEGK